MSLDDVILSQYSDIDPCCNTQEYLQNKMSFLSQDTVVSGLPTQTYGEKEPDHFLRPEKPILHTLPKADNQTEKLFTEPVLDYKDDADSSLVFVSEKTFQDFMQWSMKHESLKFGATLIDNVLLGRVLGQNKWLWNQDMDAVLYLF